MCVNRILDHTDRDIRLQIISAFRSDGNPIYLFVITDFADYMLLLDKFSMVKNMDMFLHEVYWAGQYMSMFT